MENEIFKHTGYLSVSERKKILKWLTSLPENRLIEIINNSAAIYMDLRKKRKISGKLLMYVALILSARTAGWNTVAGKNYRVAGAKQYKDWNTLRSIKAKNLKSRQSSKKSKVLAYWGEIKELKNLGLGFRKIAKYLLKYRKLKTSPSYLHKLWNEIET